MKKTVVDQMLADGHTRAYSESAFEHVFGAVREVVGRGEDVRINGFGTLKTKHRAERNARNPATGESVRVAARNVVVFQQSKSRA